MKTNNLIKFLFNCFTFLFIFTMTNKEFLFFGLDLRYISLSLGMILLFFLPFHLKKTKIEQSKFNNSGKSLIIFYVYVLVSGFFWFFNDLPVNTEKFINELILIINIFISLVVFYNYRRYVNQSFINKCLLISCLALSISIFLTIGGFTLEQISGSPNVGFMLGGDNVIGSTHVNLYGGHIRSAGYASDPNYATMLLMIGLVFLIKTNLNKVLKLMIGFIYFLAIGFAFSKTILFASLVGAIAIFIRKKVKNKKIKSFLNFFLIFTVLGISFISPQISLLRRTLPQTLTTRLNMWDCATELFIRNPIFGNGLTSFRSYFSLQNWYVQAHSTYWQILSELGIVGLGIYILNLYRCLNNQKDNYRYFLLFIFTIWIMTCESIALQFSVFILYLMNIEEKKTISEQKKALFVVNSISNGGAERVCVNMANELLRQDYSIDFIVLKHNDIECKNSSYEIARNFNVINLGIKKKSKFGKFFQLLFSIGKFNQLVEKGEYSLITSHLPMSNFICLFSKIKRECIYVFHTKLSSYDNRFHFIFGKLAKIVFYNRKVVCVSNGVKNELIEKYKFDIKNLKTIYNPIDVNEVTNKKNEAINFDNKYFLMVGRFNKAKRQDRMVEVFYRGKFYKKYKLVFCGTGELEENVKNLVEKYNLNKYVYFMGWQGNIYKWINNAELLISTSDFEAFPMNLIEAFACNTKVVSSNCNFGPNEILVDEFSKYLVDPFDIDDYIKKINMALRNYPTTNNRILELCRPDYVIGEYLSFMKDKKI